MQPTAVGRTVQKVRQKEQVEVHVQHVIIYSMEGIFPIFIWLINDWEKGIWVAIIIYMRWPQPYKEENEDNA